MSARTLGGIAVAGGGWRYHVAPRRRPSIETFSTRIPYPADVYRHRSAELQLIVNWIVDRIRPHVSIAYIDGAVDVDFHTEQRVSYPRWFLEAHGKNVIEKAVWREFGGSVLRTDDLMRTYSTLRLLPTELVDVLRAMQRIGERAPPDGE